VTRRTVLPIFLLFLALLTVQGLWGVHTLHRSREIAITSLARGILQGKGPLLLYEGPLLRVQKLKELSEGDLLVAYDPEKKVQVLLLARDDKRYFLSNLSGISAELSREIPLFLLVQGGILLLFLLLLLWIHGEIGRIEEIVGAPRDQKGFGLKALSQALRLTLESLESARKNAERLAEERGQALEELKKAQKQLLKSERLATLGYFSGGVVHEIGNPLSGALQYLEAIRGMEGKGREELEPWLERIHSELQRIEKILIALRSLARPDEIRRQKTDLIAILNRLKEGIEKESRKHPRILLHPSEPLWVETDPDLLEILLRNLLHNSVKVQGDSPYVEIHTGIREGHPEIEIRDRGPGFPPDFDPEGLFTSRQGMGFGIPLSMRIAELLGIELLFLPDPEGGRVILRWRKGFS